MMTVRTQTSAGRHVLRNPAGRTEWNLQDACTKGWSEHGLHIPGIGQGNGRMRSMLVEARLAAASLK